jgi:2-keto-4-pentenoate hydratase/2-oxohepta-3-ene-1,7-dioic acid hydratase in catechol pathway
MKTISFFSLLIIFLLMSSSFAKVTKFIRFSENGKKSYGILVEKTIYQIKGDLFSDHKKTGKKFKLSDVKIEIPVDPSKVIAAGRNYKSHIGDTPPTEYPGLFAKYPTCLIAQGENIIYPSDANNVHYEAEMVVVIGKKAKNVSKEKASEYIFGITAGNDVSERDWQKTDMQWLRAKASDTFGPLGPVVVTGLNHNDLLLQTRLNGEVRQKQRTKDLIFDVEYIVSYVSKYVTLLPGDLIFTGTPGSTKEMKPGDVVEIELEGVGILKNTVIAENTN